MKRTMISLVLASLFSASALRAQDPPPVSLADTSLQSILAVFRGEMDETILHKTRGPAGWCCLAFGFAADVLGQYTGPELGIHRPGGLRSQAELDAFAEELIAIALTTPRLTRGPDLGIGGDIRTAFRSAMRTDVPGRIPYSKSYEIQLRLYEAGRGKPWDLIDADPERGVRYLLDLAQDGELTQLEFCQLLAMAHPHGRIVANDDGTLGFELGGRYSATLTRDVFKEVGGERFVVNPKPPADEDPTLAPCYYVGLRTRQSN